MLVSRMTISPDDSPEQIEAERQRRPGGITAGFFAYFTDKFCARLLGTNLGAIDWTTVREDDIRIKPLDSSCTYSDDVASLDFPGQFHLGLSGEKPLRLLNASDVESRMLWTTALAHVIQSSLPRAETIHEIIKDTSPTSSLRNSIGNGSLRDHPSSGSFHPAGRLVQTRLLMTKIPKTIQTRYHRKTLRY